MTFDIETVPDLDAGRRLYGLEGMNDDDAHAAMTALRIDKAGTDFMPLHLHKVVAISVALRSGDDFRVWSLGEPDAGEAEVIGRFFDGIERFAPDLVSWNGSGFDLPVLHYRALLNGIEAARYWEVGDGERDWRFNNYLGRFHWRHVDLMDVLAGYQARGRAHPQLLRDRRRQHLARVPALRAPARPARCGRARCGDGACAQRTGGGRRAAPA